MSRGEPITGGKKFQNKYTVFSCAKVYFSQAVVYAKNFRLAREILALSLENYILVQNIDFCSRNKTFAQEIRI